MELHITHAEPYQQLPHIATSDTNIPLAQFCEAQILPSNKTAQKHTEPMSSAYANVNWRTINIDALDPDSAYNFDLSTLTPALEPVSTSDVQSLAGQIRQLLRGGDSEGALRGALENAPYGADERGKVRGTTIAVLL